jgi:hypothetical protein
MARATKPHYSSIHASLLEKKNALSQMVNLRWKRGRQWA